MYLTANYETFAKRFAIAAKTTASGGLNPVFGQVLLSANADDNTASLTATDTERVIKLNIPSVGVTDGGKVLLPTMLFTKILGANPKAEHIEIGVEADVLNVYIGESKYKIPTMVSESFPDFDAEPGQDAITLASTQLIDALNLTTWAVDMDNSKYALAGVLFEPGTDESAKPVFNLVATDGRRLSVVHDQTESSIPDDADKAGNRIVPGKTLALARSIAQLSGEEVSISGSYGEILFVFPDIALKSRLIEGRFPNWKKILPSTLDRHKWVFATSDLLAAVKAASVVTTALSPGIRLDFYTNGVKIMADAEGTGESTTSVKAEEAPDKVCKAKLDPAFVIQYLSALDKDGQVAVYVSEDKEKSVLFSQPVYAGESTYVLMPLS